MNVNAAEECMGRVIRSLRRLDILFGRMDIDAGSRIRYSLFHRNSPDLTRLLTMTTPINKTKQNYLALAQYIGARARCANANNQTWYQTWTERIASIMEGAPSGLGIDNGTQLDLDASTSEKLIFTVSFHHMDENHMDENGGYDGWTNHVITVRGSLEHEFTLTISGRNRNDIKTYLGEMVTDWLTETAHNETLTQ